MIIVVVWEFVAADGCQACTAEISEASRREGVNALGCSVEQIACGDGLTGTGNSLVKSQGSRKKGGERWLPYGNAKGE
jgi:hypothetical protein